MNARKKMTSAAGWGDAFIGSLDCYGLDYKKRNPAETGFLLISRGNRNPVAGMKTRCPNH